MAERGPARPLHIGLDYTSAVRQGGGIGRYTRELVRALLALDPTNRYTLLVADPRPLPAPPGPNARFRRLPLGDVWLHRLWHRARVPLPVEWLTGPVDLFHQPDFVLPPARPGTATLLTVHDLTFVRDPDSAPPALRRYLGRVVPRSVARSDHVLADSAATRADLLEVYAAPPDKVSVLYPGVDARFRPPDDPAALAGVRARYALGPEPFVLSVGTLQPRKNSVRLIQAFARLLAARPGEPLQLVIAGSRGWQFDAIFAEVERQGLAGRVRFPGFVADEDLPALYGAAAVLAYPALYEGFGLPVLEALACGTPVVTSTRSSLPEAAGDAALLVDPLDVDALAGALGRLLNDGALRAALRERGLDHAARFTWARAAGELLGVYRALASRARSRSPAFGL
jgi:glycosyltransferase involved in cell wall biosynthesis